MGKTSTGCGFPDREGLVEKRLSKRGIGHRSETEGLTAPRCDPFSIGILWLSLTARQSQRENVAFSQERSRHQVADLAFAASVIPKKPLQSLIDLWENGGWFRHHLFRSKLDVRNGD